MMRALPSRPGPLPGRPSHRSGLTLIEILVSATVFAVIAGAVCNAIVASMALNKINRESATAMHAASSMLEELKGTPVDEVFARYNLSAADDPATGASPGRFFAVDGLELVEGDADGFVGEVFFPGDGVALRESWNDRDLGMPRDLNGDGVVDKDDRSGDYRMLPVRIVVEWSSRTGTRRAELVSVLTDF